MIHQNMKRLSHRIESQVIWVQSVARKRKERTHRKTMRAYFYQRSMREPQGNKKNLSIYLFEKRKINLFLY